VISHYLNAFYHNPFSSHNAFKDVSVLIDYLTFKNTSVERVANVFRLRSFSLVILASSFLLKHLIAASLLLDSMKWRL